MEVADLRARDRLGAAEAHGESQAVINLICNGTEGDPALLNWPFACSSSTSADPAGTRARGMSGGEILRAPAVLSAAECDEIIRLAAALAPQWGSHSGIDVTRRRSKVRWLKADSSTQWIYERVESTFARANADFGVAVDGLAEELQFTEYEAGMHFDWHVDSRWVGPVVRKLSLTIQLSDPAIYDGGGLEFDRPGNELVLSRRRGTAIVFPSFVAHRVTAVTRGTRYSLVAWAVGAPWR